MNPLDLLDKLPPLKAPKNPAIAVVLGLLLGGIGLGIYFRSWLDGLIPLVVVLIISQKLGGSGVAFGAAIAAAYGALRAISSNRQLAATPSPH